MGYFRCNWGVYFNKLRQEPQSFKIAESFNKLITRHWISTAVSQTTHIPHVLVSNADRNPATFIEVRRGFPQYLTNRFYFYYVGAHDSHRFFSIRLLQSRNLTNASARTRTSTHTYLRSEAHTLLVMFAFRAYT